MKIFFKLLVCFFSAVLFVSCVSTKNSVFKENQPDIIANMVSLYYNRYFSYPNSVEELCAFAENQDVEGLFDNSIRLLRKNKKEIRILSDANLFFLFFTQKDISVFLKKNICDVVSLEFGGYNYPINYYNLKGRNLNIQKGFFADKSIEDEWEEDELRKELVNLRRKYDDWHWVILKGRPTRLLLPLVYKRGVGLSPICDNILLDIDITKDPHFLEIEACVGAYIEKNQEIDMVKFVTPLCVKK